MERKRCAGGEKISCDWMMIALVGTREATVDENSQC